MLASFITIIIIKISHATSNLEAGYVAVVECRAACTHFQHTNGCYGLVLDDVANMAIQRGVRNNRQ